MRIKCGKWHCIGRREGLNEVQSPTRRHCHMRSTGPRRSNLIISIQMTTAMWMSLFALALPLATLSAGSKARTWQTGTLMDVSVNSVDSVHGVNGIINTTRINFWSYTLDAGDRVYVGEHRSRKPIQMEVNGPIQFAVEKDHIFILDHERKEFRLNIIKTTLKTR